MQAQTGGKLFSFFILTGVVAYLIHHQNVVWAARGRDAYVAHYAANFDKYVAHPNVAAIAIGSFIIVGATIVLYEAIAKVAAKFMSGQEQQSAGAGY